MVSEEEDENDETMEEGGEGDNEGIWMDGEDDPPDDLRYNEKCKKNRCITCSVQKTVLKRAIATLARLEAKSAIQFRSKPHRLRLLT